MKTAFTLGLRGRLILLLLAAFALLAGLLAWHFVDHGRERIGAVSTDLFDRTRLIAAETRTFAAQADAILNGLMLSPEMQPGAPAEACAQFIRARLKQESAFAQGGRTLPDGEVACVSVPPKSRVSYADRAWFQSALRSHEIVISEVLLGRIVGKPVIVFAKAMRDVAGRVTGVLYPSLDLAWLQRELTSAALPEGARLVVVDAKGTMALHHPDPDGWLGKSATHLPLLQRILAAGGEGTVEEIGLDGERRLFAYTKLLDTVSGPVYLWLSVPKAVLEAPAWRAALFSMGILLAVLISTIGLLVWGGNRLVLRPLLSLSRAAARFKAGDLTARSGLPHGDDELGRVARVLDETAATIEDRERKLARANRALRVLSGGNRALLRSKDEQALIEEMCRVIVQAGDYRIAWVGYAEDDPARSVRIVAAWGVTKDSLEDLRITWDETESGRGAAGAAIRRGVAIVSKDIETDPDYAFWRELARRHGFASALALPLRLDDSVIGALCVCAAEPDAFDEGVVEILSETADDLAFGIATQRAKVKHGRTRAALQSAEERFHAAAEAGLDALFILASVRGERGDILDFKFTDINVRAEQMLGMARGTVIGQKLCELLPVNRSGGFFDKYAAVVATGTPLEEEFSIDTPQIKAKWLRHQVVRVGDGIAISSRDITEWKQAGAALRESEERYRNATETTRDAFVIVEGEGGTVRAWNPAAVAIFGYSKEEAIGRGIHDFLPTARDREAARHGMEHFAKTGEGAAIGKTTELVAVRKDGTEFPLELSLSAMQIHEKWHATGIMRDISERKKHETHIVKLNRALRTLSACNVALVHARSENALFETVCRHIVDTGGYRVAFIGFPEEDAEKTVSIAAQHGAEAGYLESLRFTWADIDRGQGTVGRAIRSGAPQVAQNVLSDPRFGVWREVAEKLEIKASVSLPLKGEDGGVFGVLTIGAAAADIFDADEIKLLAELADDVAFGIATLRTRAERDRIGYAHAHHAQILQKSLEQSIQVIAATVEARDPYTAGHQRRVAELAVAVARELGLREDRIHGIHLAAVIHDLGKIHVPAEILSKPGKLSEVEFMLIKVHPQASYDILKDVDFPWPIADIVRQHHERLDGSGYPQGLKDGQILLESRIMSVADVMEAMASHRPYRAALGVEVALKEIERGRGSAYDPAVADACLKLFREGRFAFHA